MKKTVLIILTLIAGAYYFASAQEISDYIVLKNGNGNVKGLISEQVPGKNVTIISTEATLKIKESEQISHASSRKKKINDSTEINIDVVHLKNNRIIEGEILEQSPGNWLIIKADSIGASTYLYSEIDIIGKELTNNKTGIVKAYGLKDVVYFNDNKIEEGVIVEQQIGKNIKIEKDNGTKLVFPSQNIVKIEKKGADANVNIFNQSAFLDKVSTRNGNEVFGIITEQIPGVSIKIITKESNLFTEQWSNIEKIGKEKNKYRTVEQKKNPIKEPEFIGSAFFIFPNDSVAELEKKKYYTSKKEKHTLYFNDDKGKSPIRISDGDSISMIVKVANNEVSPFEQIYIFKIDIKKIKKQYRRYINTDEQSILNKNTNNKGKYLNFEYEKTGKSSFSIKFPMPLPGEYAIFVEGNPKSFSLFGIDTKKADKNENNNRRKR